MIVYLLPFLFIFQKIASQLCPETSDFFLTPNEKCFKIYHGRHGYQKVFHSCSQKEGILSGFVTDSETYGFNLIIEKHFKKIKEKYVDRGFTCYSKNKACFMNRNHNQKVGNKIEFLTDNFPCRGVMDIKRHTLHCIDMTSENDIIYACQKDPPYVRNCSNLDYQKYGDGNCYRLIGDFVVTKKTAEAICKDESGTLPIITNYFENYVINKLVNQIQSSIWLDFSCSTKDGSSCKWSTGEEMEINQLGNFNLRDDNLCGYIKKVGTWNTDHCDTQKRILCQIKNK